MVLSDDRTCEFIPDQISGIFVGWAKLKMHGFSKVVVGIGWDFSQQTPERVMHIDFLDSSSRIRTEPVELLVTGYVRKLKCTDNILQALSITDEDRRIASKALDLPAFSECTSGHHLT
uniref:Riboflavin kinase n=1 Tax=Arundo donax TaxID=35708 RepID=A0A0A9FMA8_ARUDO